MEILPNHFGFTSADDIALSELEGFLRTEIELSEMLTPRTRFTVAYILNIHKRALGHLYPFAGKYRDVNISKGGFPFAAARFLPQSMLSFEQEVLARLSEKYNSRERLISDIAAVHGELLFIHPFREGNGRTARVLANLMLRKQGLPPLRYELVTTERFSEYVLAVQASASQNYGRMETFIASLFPDQPLLFQK